MHVQNCCFVYQTWPIVCCCCYYYFDVLVAVAVGVA